LNPDRQQALQLLTEFTKSDSLIKHALAVEAAMRAYARRFGEDEDRWGIVGLIHDFDYEAYPTLNLHVIEGVKILRDRGWPEEMIRAVESHASYTGVSRDTTMERTLFAVDELVGFITAVALVRPSRSIMDVDPSSVRKKMKDKAFARSVNRQDIVEGAEALGVPLDEHIAFVVEAMRGIAGSLGLEGTQPGKQPSSA
jgi:putative nucleotidyltransferase with HDIG domain